MVFLKVNEESRLSMVIEEEQIRMSLVRLSSSCGVLRECIGRRILLGVGGVCRGIDLFGWSSRVVLNEVCSRSCMSVVSL